MVIDGILAVVVLYQCDLKDSITLDTLNKSVMRSETVSLNVLVYDNSEQSHSDADLSLFPCLSIDYKHDELNPGVSKAYNIGAKRAKELNKIWLLVFDQDTTINIGYIQNLISAKQKYKTHQLIVPQLFQGETLISPCKYSYKRGSGLLRIGSGVNSLKNKSLLNSGLAIKLDLFDKVNGFDQDVKLYFSDFVFVDKLRKEVSEFVVLDDVFLHEMSSNDESDLKTFYGRLLLYCKGAKEAASHTNFIGKINYLLICLFRVFKVAVKHKSLLSFKCLKPFFNV